MKRIISLLLAAMMVITMLPTVAIADELNLFAADEQPVAEAPTEEPAEQEQPAEEAPAQQNVTAVSETGSGDNILTNMVFSNLGYAASYMKYEWKLSPQFSADTKEYTINVPADKYNLYLFVWFSDKYPNVTATAEYDYNGSTQKRNLKNGKGISLSAIKSGYTTNTITITVKSNDENDITEVYTVNVKREECVSNIWFAGSDERTYQISGTLASPYNHTLPDLKVPANVTLKIDRMFGYNESSTIEIVEAVDGVLTPKFTDGVYEYTVKVSAAEEGVLPVTYTGRIVEVPKLVIETPPTKTEYQMGEKFDITGMVLKAVYENREETVDLSKVTYTPTGNLTDENKEVTIYYLGEYVILPITVKAYEFEGEGTKENPYLLNNADDCVGLSTAVNAGKKFANCYFKITADITLPEGWVPIGGTTYPNAKPTLSGRFYNYFSGHIDGANPEGGNFLLTIPKDEKTLLGCVMDGGSLSNLDIYGERINGYGVMDNYVVGTYGVPCMDIINVNLKSGTHTKMSGFLGGYASGSNTVNIINCTIEEGVVIGDDGSWGDVLNWTYNFTYVDTVQYNDMVGSFAGAFNGNIVNCKSYATVYGHDYVGGIVGFKGQSMGDCRVENCEFGGKVIATGDYVGGIIGSGYQADSAPNTPCVTIQNCIVTGSVTGNDKVGGIFGGNAKTKQCWNNGFGYIRANLVTGTVTATAENATVGAIIGHINAINMCNVIKDNYYVEGVSAKGIGEITTVAEGDYYWAANKYCDTQAVSAADLTNGKAVELLNSAKAGVNPWKQGENSPVLSGNNRIYKVVMSKLNGMNPTAFQSNNGYNSYITAGGDITAYYLDGTSVTVPVTDGVTIGPDFNASESGTQLCSVLYDGYEHFFGIKLTIQNQELAEQQMKAVKVKILGDTVHEVTADNVHTLADGNLIEWLGETTIMVPTDATAYDAVVKAAKAFAMSYEEKDTEYGKYIYSLSKNGVTLSDSSNKQSDGNAYCGWQFTVNGNSVYTSLDQTEVKDGDTVLFYFEDDYSLAYVQSAIDAVKAIPETTASDYDEKVDAAEASLAYLSPIALEKVKADPSFAKLAAARNARAAKAVEELIKAIGEVTKDSGKAISDARNAYDALTDEQKELVSNYKKLVSAEREYYKLIHADDEPIHVVIGAATNAAAKGEENPNTGAEVLSIAPVVLVLKISTLK